jgi:phosphoesterase RecJ-like protein
MKFDQQEIEKCKLLIDKANNILISTHKSPDGDAIGSSTALYHILTAHGKQCEIILPDDAPDFLKWMLQDVRYKVYETDNDQVTHSIASCDLLFVCDYNHFGRVGKELETIFTASKMPAIMIDHHQQPASFPTVTMSDTSACSTCEMIYRFANLCGLDQYIGKSAATSIYCGIMTDTGSFRFDSVKAETHRIVAHLMEMGIDHAAIHREVYDTQLPERLKLVGYSLHQKLNISNDGYTAWIWLDAEELKAHSYRQGDAEGLVNYALSIKGVKLAAFFREGNNEIKISFRSKGQFDVNTFARNHWNGGGHFHAAGGSSSDSMKDVLTIFQNLLHQYAIDIKQS